MTDEYINQHADRYVSDGLRECGVTLLQYLADPARYAPLADLLPRQKIAAGKAISQLSETSE